MGEAAHDSAVDIQYLVGSAYLAIGLFVYFRRGSAQKARHFFLFCLVSFIFSCFHYTGKLNNFDKVIYWGNLVAGWLAPTLFLHFCLTFPEPRALVPPAAARSAALPAGHRLHVGLYRASPRALMRVDMPAGPDELVSGPRLDGAAHRALPGQRPRRSPWNTAARKIQSCASS